MMEESTMQEWRYGYAHKDLDCWDTTFLTTSDCNEEAFMDFSLNPTELHSWQDVLILQEEYGSLINIPSSRSEEAFEQLKEVPNDDLVIDECPSEGEDKMLYDDIFSNLGLNLSETPCNELGTAPPSMRLEISSIEEDLMNVVELPNDSEEITMEDSEGLICEDYYSVGNKSQSSEAFNISGSVECDWPATAPLIPCSTNSAEYIALRIVHLLTACAEAISDGGAHELVQIILCRLKELVSPTGSTMQRVAYYLSQSLQQRHDHRHMEAHMFRSNYNGTKDPNYLGAFSLLNQVYPYIRFAHFTANQSILEAIPAHAQNVHIIDFDIMEGMQWPPLMVAFQTQNYRLGYLKITAVKWDDGAADDDDDIPGPSSSCCKNTGRRLSEYASSLGIPFSFEESTQFQNLIGPNEDEIVIVNCMWELPHMFERSRKQLIEFLHAVCHLNPAVMTLGSGPNGIVSHKKLNFLDRFAQCLKNLCAVFDSLEAELPQEYELARVMVERSFMGPMMCRPINYSSEAEDEEEELSQVVEIPLKYGFTEVDISKKNVMYAKYIAEQRKEYVSEMVGSNKVVLKWQSTPLSCVSSWKPRSFTK